MFYKRHGHVEDNMVNDMSKQRRDRVVDKNEFPIFGRCYNVSNVRMNDPHIDVTLKDAAIRNSSMS